MAAALETKDPLERREGIKRILKIGGEAAVPYLEKDRQDESFVVRSEAEKALKKIER